MRTTISEVIVQSGMVGACNQSGSAAVHGGKPPAYRSSVNYFLEAPPQAFLAD